MFLNNYKCTICHKTFDIDFPEGEGTGEIACPECGKKYQVTISNDRFIIVPKKAVTVEKKEINKEQNNKNIEKNKNNADIRNDDKKKIDEKRDSKNKNLIINIIKAVLVLIICIILFPIISNIILTIFAGLGGFFGWLGEFLEAILLFGAMFVIFNFGYKIIENDKSERGTKKSD